LSLKIARSLRKFQLLEGFKRLFTSAVKSLFKLGDGRPKVVPSCYGRPGESRVGEVIDVTDAGGLLLDFDLLIEVARHAAEVGDHHFEVADLLPLFVILKTLILLRINCLDHDRLRPLLRLPLSTGKCVKQFRSKQLMYGKESPLCNRSGLNAL
jgi:hypothetical protein